MDKFCLLFFLHLSFHNKIPLFTICNATKGKNVLPLGAHASIFLCPKVKHMLQFDICIYFSLRFQRSFLVYPYIMFVIFYKKILPFFIFFSIKKKLLPLTIKFYKRQGCNSSTLCGCPLTQERERATIIG